MDFMTDKYIIYLQSRGAENAILSSSTSESAGTDIKHVSILLLF